MISEVDIQDWDIDYEVLCDDEFCASSNDYLEALRYAAQYAEDGIVAIYEVRRKLLKEWPQ